MEFTFYVQVAKQVDRYDHVTGLRLVKATVNEPTKEIGGLVIRIPLEIPLEAFEHLAAEKMVVKPRNVSVSAPADPQDSTIALAKELSGGS